LIWSIPLQLHVEPNTRHTHCHSAASGLRKWLIECTAGFLHLGLPPPLVFLRRQPHQPSPIISLTLVRRVYLQLSIRRAFFFSSHLAIETFHFDLLCRLFHCFLIFLAPHPLPIPFVHPSHRPSCLPNQPTPGQRNITEPRGDPQALTSFTGRRPPPVVRINYRCPIVTSLIQSFLLVW
jgi:hypothetical protein